MYEVLLKIKERKKFLNWMTKNLEAEMDTELVEKIKREVQGNCIVWF